MMKKYGALILLLGWVVLVLFLSFQSGQDTADISFHFTKSVLKLVTKTEPDWQIIMLWDGRFRFAAHFVLFFLYGIFSMRVLAVWIEQKRRVILLSGCSGILLAVFSEIGKLFIAERHCNPGEMLLNIIGVFAGISLTVLISVLWKYLGDKCLPHSK